MKNRFLFLFPGILFLMLLPAILRAQPFVLNGSATALGGDCFQLTPNSSSQAGSLFAQNPIDLTQPFSEQVSLYFGNKDNNGADGIVFILATSNMALGGGGGGIGYQGITPSIAVEMDDYQNSNFGDPANDHMAVISMGQIDHTMPTNLVGPMNIPNVEDDQDHCFFIDWNPVTQTLSAALDDDIITYTGNIVANIFGGNPLVYYGFSSGTGGLSNIHRVCFGPPALDPMPDVSVCEGESVTLQADDKGIAWTWEPDPTLSSLIIQDPDATPDITTTYMVEIEYQCGFFNYDTVMVTVLPLPEPEADNNSPICVGETLFLTASGGTSYEWDGPSGFISGVQNPTISNVDPADAGWYTVTVTDAAGCSATATTEVIIDEGPEIFFDDPPSPLCENLDPFLMTATPPGGEWDGDITPGGLFDPSYVGVGTTTVTYTVENALGCVSTASIDLDVLSVPDVVINPPGPLCEGGAPVQLTGSPAGGVWDGEVTLNGIFDPVTAGLGSHLVTYTANDGNGCTNSESIIIQVVSQAPADILTPGPFCGMDTIFLMASPPGGIWAGGPDSNGILLPNQLPSGAHLITYQSGDNNACFYAQALIDIQYAPPVSCQSVPLSCVDATPFYLTADPTGGVWTGAASPDGFVDPSQLGPGIHTAFYHDTVGVCAAFGNSCWIYVEVVDAPAVQNRVLTCDNTGTTFTVSFEITGGDPATYAFQGSVPGLLTPGVPYIFVSDPIPSGNSYQFAFWDQYQCDTVDIIGSYQCNCATDAGTMDTQPISVCEGDTIYVSAPTGFIADPNDTLVYVLHQGDPYQPLVYGMDSAFVLQPPLQAGVTYFISALIGNSIPTGVDLLDPCLSVAPGPPVVWNKNPDGQLSAPGIICQGDSAALTFTLNGTGPFNIQYAEGAMLHTLNGIGSGYVVSVYPTAMTTYTLMSVAEQSPPGCANLPGASVTIDVGSVYSTSNTAQICEGDSILLGGAYQTTAGVYIDAYTTVLGCDSIIQTQLAVSPVDTVYIDDTSCDPAQTGVFTQVYSNQAGCDSTVITTVTYSLADTTLLQSTTCDLQSAGVFTNLFSGTDGCDSLTIETILYIEPDTMLINSTTCDPSEAGMFITVLLNVGGCDSTIIETIQLVASDTTQLSGTTCVPAEAGVFTTLLTNAGGCDSLVIETVALLPSDTVLTQQVTCQPQDTGIIQQVLTNIYGCDSLVLTHIILGPLDSCYPVVHREIYIPNVFSPNGDGINDYFFLSSYPDAVSSVPYLRIYDRWGGLVYEGIERSPNQPEQGWDGRIKGEPINPGVFAWVAEVIFSDGRHATLYGDVTLVR